MEESEEERLNRENEERRKAEELERNKTQDSFTDASFSGANSTSVNMENSMKCLASALYNSSTVFADSLIRAKPCVAEDAPFTIPRKAYIEWKLQIRSLISPTAPGEPANRYGIFRQAAGSRLLALLDSLDLSSDIVDSQDPCSEALARLDKHFEAEGNNFISRMNFIAAEQKPGEGNVEFLSRKLEEAKWCGFEKTKLEFELVFGIAATASNDKIKTRAAEVGCKFAELRSLASAIDLTTNIDSQKKRKKISVNAVSEASSSRNHKRQLSDSDDSANETAPKRKHYREDRQEDWNRRGKYRESQNRNYNAGPSRSFHRDGYQSRNLGAPGARSSSNCKCCGFYGHEAADCRKKDEICHNCHKKGHLVKMCLRRPKEKVQQNKPQSRGKTKKHQKASSGNIFRVEDAEVSDCVEVGDSSDNTE